jgi:hypothetical protein
VEFLAQLRNTGRVFDGFKSLLDGPAPLKNVTVDLSSIFPVEAYQGWKLAPQFWAKNIVI